MRQVKVIETQLTRVSSIKELEYNINEALANLEGAGNVVIGMKHIEYDKHTVITIIDYMEPEKHNSNSLPNNIL